MEHTVVGAGAAAQAKTTAAAATVTSAEEVVAVEHFNQTLRVLDPLVAMAVSAAVAAPLLEALFRVGQAVAATSQATQAGPAVAAAQR
jgi:hypothetical protein